MKDDLRIAVTGIGIICSVARDAEEFAAALKGGHCGIGPIATIDPSWSSCRIAAEVHDFAPPPLPHVSADLVRGELLAVVASGEALANAGLDASALEHVRVGASFGTCQNAVAEMAAFFEPSDGDDLQFAGSPADAVGLAFGLTGPRAVASNACAAGGSAIAMARDYILSGAADVMLAGGGDSLAFFSLAGFSALHSLDLSPCSPYGRSSGLNLGEAGAALVLETFAHARARGAPIIAELAGCGASADGYHPTAPDPTGRGAALAVERALRGAGIDPSEVDYVNGHGTGTPANDAMERVAFRRVFGKRAHVLPISSTKSMVGHTLGAAGAVEAIACILAIRDGFLPPTINVPVPVDPEFDFVANASRPAKVRVAASTSYAFGGSNSAIVFRDATSPLGDAGEPEPALEQRVLITGIGAVGAPGEGIDDWKSALAGADTFITNVVIEDALGRTECLGMSAPPLAPKRYASRSDWRKMNDFARGCVASTRLAWIDAALALGRTELDDVALVLATSNGATTEISEFERSSRVGADEASPNIFPHTAVSAAAGHVCTVFGIHGQMLSVSQGGASALVALNYAANLIRRRECEIAIVLAGDEFAGATHAAMVRSDWSTLSQSVVRPFDQRADGMAGGSATVAIVLESEEHARARDVRPYAEVLGAGVAGCLDDAASPDTSRSWARSLHLALDGSNIQPADVGYVVASASGIPEVDAAELNAYEDMFSGSVAVTAPKAMTGELLAASGAVNVMVAALALRDGILMPTANLEMPIGTSNVKHVMGHVEERAVDYCIASASSPGATYASMVLGRSD